jgi:lipoyl-dependent peroxiredoxin
MDEAPRVTFSVTRRADVTWSGSVASGTGVIAVPSGVLDGAAITYPSRTGEPEGHTSPEELIASAHAGCFAMSLAGALGAEEIEYQTVEVTAQLTLGRVDGVMKLIGAEVDAVVVGAHDFAAIDGAVATADSRCPVSTALRASMPVIIRHRVEIAA